MFTNTLRNAMRTLSVAFLILAVFLTVATPAFASAPTGHADWSDNHGANYKIVSGEGSSSYDTIIYIRVPAEERNVATAVFAYPLGTTEVVNVQAYEVMDLQFNAGGGLVDVTNNLGYSMGGYIKVTVRALENIPAGSSYGLGDNFGSGMGHSTESATTVDGVMAFGDAETQQVYWQQALSEEGIHSSFVGIVSITNADLATSINPTVYDGTKLTVYTDDKSHKLGECSNTSGSNAACNVDWSTLRTVLKGINGSPYIWVEISAVNPEQVYPAGHTIGVILP